MGTIISWTDETWNPVTGCSKVSEGCRNCYAERLSLKFGYTKLPWTAANAAANVHQHPERLAKLKSYKAGTRVFVNSMSDLFHPQVSEAFVHEVLDTCAARPDLIFQCLTKRPERAKAFEMPSNFWIGTSIEDSRVLYRLDQLCEVQADVHFISFEPMIGPIEPDLRGISWCIVGGESGPDHRVFDHRWACTIRDAASDCGTAFFFKQSAAYTTERGVALDHGDGTFWIWHQMPGDLKEAQQVPRQMDARQWLAWTLAHKAA